MSAKKNLVGILAKNFDDLSIEDAASAIDCIFDYIKLELAKGNPLEIRGFGSMSVRKRKYPEIDKHYNTVYYRMSKNVYDDLNHNAEDVLPKLTETI